jgi:zinc transport system permease protein
MMEYLDYTFFRYALAGVVLISISAAVVGSYIITRRLVAIAGGITHACFGGLGLGYFLGFNPAAMAAVFAVASSAGVEWMAQRMRLREDSAIAVVWSLGMAVGVLFVFLTPGYVPELNSFLFGNILTINETDIYVFAAFTLVLCTFFAWRFKQIVAVAFDRDFARVQKLPVRFVSYAMTVFVAVCIVLTIRLVGVMLLMSVMSLPMMTAEVFCRRFSSMVFVSAGVAVAAGVAGLFAGAAADVPCSAMIVLILAFVFVAAKAVECFRARRAS